jgi:UDP-N-acetylglucosamine transferase subunit ALG13
LSALIFVTLGTHERPFYRLVKEIEKLIQGKKIREKVVIQLGFTDYFVKGAECYNFMPEEKFQKYLKNCSVLITHGGLGSIMRGINARKVVIAVPRRKKFNEHTDDHQLQIVKEARKRGSVLVVYNIKNLFKAIEKAKKLKAKKREYKPEKMLKIIERILKNWERKYENRNCNSLL